MSIKSTHYLSSVVEHEFKATVQIKWANVSGTTQISHATTIFVLNITSRTFQTVLVPAVSKLGVISKVVAVGNPMKCKLLFTVRELRYNVIKYCM